MSIGTLPPTDHLVMATYKVTLVIGGVKVTPDLASLAPGTVGVFQVRATLPQQLPAGTAVVYVLVTLPDGMVVESDPVTMQIATQ